MLPWPSFILQVLWLSKEVVPTKGFVSQKGQSDCLSKRAICLSQPVCHPKAVYWLESVLWKIFNLYAHVLVIKCNIAKLAIPQFTGNIFMNISASHWRYWRFILSQSNTMNPMRLSISAIYNGHHFFFWCCQVSYNLWLGKPAWVF